VRDHDELRSIGVVPQQLDEAADVRVVERCLDLVEKVERARPGEEQREEERDRAERLLAAGESDSRCTFLPAGRSSTSMPGWLSSSSGKVSCKRPSPPGNSVPATSWKFSAPSRTSRRSGARPSLQLCAQLLELGEALLEVGALRRELVEPQLLRVVLLLRERFTWPSCSRRRSSRSARSCSSCGRRLRPRCRCRRGRAGAAPRRLRLDARNLDVDRGCPFGSLREPLAQLDLEAPRRRSSSPSAPVRAAARIDLRAKRSLEACGRSDRRMSVSSRRSDAARTRAS